MKKILLGLAALSALAGPSFAASAQEAPVPITTQADSQTIAAALDLLDAMNVRTAMMAAMKQGLEAIPEIMRARSNAKIDADTSMNAAAKKAAREKFEATLGDTVGFAESMMNDPVLSEKMITEAAQLYARHFTTAELKDLAAFYRTPLGSKMLVTMPVLAAEGKEIPMRVALPYMRKLVEGMKQGTQAK